jgi:hypothetical protein
MPLLRQTTLPALTTELQVEAPELDEEETAHTIETLIGTVLQDFPWGSPVHVDPYLAELPPPGGASGPLLLGGSLLPGSQLRLLWRGPCVAGPRLIRVSIFPTLQVG